MGFLIDSPSKRMELKLLAALFIGSASSFIVHEEPKSAASRALCCSFINVVTTCATQCASKDCTNVCYVRCGVLNSLCASLTCSQAAPSTCVATTAAAATTASATTSSCLGAVSQCGDGTSTPLGTCCDGYECVPLSATAAYCVESTTSSTTTSTCGGNGSACLDTTGAATYPGCCTGFSCTPPSSGTIFTCV